MPERYGSVVILNGLAGTGSSTVAKLLQKELGFEYVYGGGIFRKMAEEEGKTFEQALADLKGDPEKEKRVDDRLIKRAKRGKVIIESRVLAWLLPETPSFKVWLVCDRKERERRIFEREGTDDVFERMIFREKVDAERYRSLYGIEMDDFSAYDEVIDTTNMPPIKVMQQILKKFQV